MKSSKRDPQQITRTASNEVLEKWGEERNRVTHHETGVLVDVLV